MTKSPTRDDVLRKMLKTPPKPFTPKKPVSKSKKGLTKAKPRKPSS